MRVRLISVTKPEISIDNKVLSADGLIAYCARVSSPNQENSSHEKLITYCLKHGHWSIFEMVDMTVEILTSRAIAQQLLRHRSFCFQEFSQRYATPKEVEVYPARRQDVKNRQNSIDDISEHSQDWFLDAQKKVKDTTFALYDEALKKGIAKECARILLPLGTKTCIYMKGSARSWVHYIQLRLDKSTQKEHRGIADEIRKIFISQFPSVASALNWTE